MKRSSRLLLTISSIVMLTGCSQSQDKKNVSTDASSQSIVETIGASDEAMSRVLDDSGETYEIKTNKVTLSYPGKWKDLVETEDSGNSVSFYADIPNHDKMLLFTIEFGDSNGYLLGTLNGMDVSIVESPLEFGDDWTDSGKNEVYAMKEDVNVLLDGLSKTKGFKANE